MLPTRPNSDTTIRGGIINVPASTSPTQPPRHQPDTPRTKKIVKPKPDHQVYGGDSTTTIKDTPPPPPSTANENEPRKRGRPKKQPDEPETDPPD